MKPASKKAQLESRMVIYVMIAVVVIILLISSLVFIKNMKDKQKKVLLEKMKQDLAETVDTLDYGSRQEKCTTLPEGTSEVCIFDLNKRTEILKSPLINRFPQIKDSIEGGVPKNLFTISGKKIESMYVGDVCMDHYPYYSCFEVPNNRLCIQLEGKGRCALLVRDFKICYPPLTNDKVPEEFKLGSSLATLLFKKDTILTYPPVVQDKTICIEPIPAPAGTSSLVSEVYNITPKGTTTSSNIELTMRYFTEFLKTNADISKIKIKQYDTTKTDWNVLTSTKDVPKKKITSGINKFEYVAVFGPEPPRAIMKLKYPSGAEVKPTKGIYVISQNNDIKYDASDSYDPDDKSASDKGIVSYNWEFKWQNSEGPKTQTCIGETTNPNYDVITYLCYLKVDILPANLDVTLTVEDKDGNIGTSTIRIQILKTTSHGSGGGNVKKPSIYDEDTEIIINPVVDTAKVIFIIKDTGSNENNILRMIPVAMFDGSIFLGFQTTYNYPLLAYKEKTPADASFNLEKIKQSYKPPTGPLPKIIYIKNTDGETVPNAINNELDEIIIKMSDYFTFWQQYDDIVVAEETPSNPQTKLLAALYASEINAPLVFISSADCSNLGTALSTKTIHLIESNLGLTSCTPNIIKHSLAELQNSFNMNYQKLESTFLPASHLP